MRTRVRGDSKCATQTTNKKFSHGVLSGDTLGGTPFLFSSNMVKKVEKIHAMNADGDEAYFHPQSWAAMPVGEDGKRYGWAAVMQTGAKSERPVAPATPKAPGRPEKAAEFGDVNKD